MADDDDVIRLLAFDGYRSLCDLRLELDQLTVITGGNGTGKSNVYHHLEAPAWKWTS